MSKYDSLWHYVVNSAGPTLRLSFDEVQTILGAEIDHSFLQYKKELISFGWQVDKISLKNRTVLFRKIQQEEPQKR